MSELLVRIPQLREAADAFRKSALALDLVSDQVQQILAACIADGIDVSAYYQRVNTSTLDLSDWAYTLKRFAGKLDGAADDVETAYIQARPLTFALPDIDLGSGTVSTQNGHWSLTFGLRGTKYDTAFTPPLPVQPPSFAYTDYVAPVNRGIYDELVARQLVLKEQQQKLSDLQTAQIQARDDLTALRDRLVAYDPNLDLASVPRLQVMETQLADYDAQIATTQAEIDDLNVQIHTLETRLDRVKPAAGADLAVVTSMEQTQTPIWVQANTYDCVKHVVGKVSIPNGMAQDAYLWDDLATQLPDYGITVGDVPLKGSVIVLEREHAYASDAYGHLLYVERVDAAGVWVTDNNHPDPIRFSELTTETSGANVKVLYFPWHTRA